MAESLGDVRGYDDLLLVAVLAATRESAPTKRLRVEPRIINSSLTCPDSALSSRASLAFFDDVGKIYFAEIHHIEVGCRKDVNYTSTQSIATNGSRGLGRGSYST